MMISLKLAGVTTLIFIFQLMLPNFTDAFILRADNALSSPWTLVTSIFLHADFNHLFYNMFALIMFGWILENIIGEKKFLMLFFTSGVAASIGAALFYPASLGASGAIFGVIGMLAVLRPRMVVYVGFVPMPMILATFFWAAGDFIGLFYPSEIASAAHLFGLVVGLVYALSLRKRFGESNKPKGSRICISENDFRKWEDRWLRLLE